MNWTAELCYVIGLITTDGNLSKDLRHIEFTSKDLDQVETFASLLKLKNKISVKSSCYRIQFGNVKLYQLLLEIGLMPNKSLTIAELKIPNNYFRDFLRGHLDGDGSLIYYKDSYNTKINPKYVYTRFFVYFRSASEKHILWLRGRISKILGTHGSISALKSKTQKGSSQEFTLKFSTNEAKIIVNWIYYQQNLPCLKRKYKTARPFLKSFTSQ